MARGIEHREKETVLEAYSLQTDKPNWAIFSGTEPVITFDDGNIDDGAQRLENYLQMLEDSPTKTVFTLRVYYPETTKITNKTQYAGSTTFMLSKDAALTKDPGTGLLVLDRGQGTNKTDNTAYSSLSGRLDSLEQENKRLLQQLHQEEIKRLEDRMSAAISGINQPVNRWDKILDIIEAKPEIIPNSIDKILGYFMNRNTPAPEPIFSHTNPIAGTTATEPAPASNGTINNDMSHQEPTTLTEEELDILHEKQSEFCDNLEDRLGAENFTLYLEQLAAMPDEQLTNWSHQEQHLHHIRQRLDGPTITKLLQAVTEMNDKSLNKLLNYLD